MAIHSMTGFGSGEAVGGNYTLTVEIKSVNNRFKDMRFKMSTLFNSQEINLRKKLEEKCKRGTFDVHINYKRNPDLSKTSEVDWNLAKAYLDQVKEVANETGATFTIQPTEFLRSDFLVEDDTKKDELTMLLFEAFQDALSSLMMSRQEEGESLVETLREHKLEYTKHYQEVIPLKDGYQDQVREKLLKKFDNEKKNLKEANEDRFHQEVIYYLEKLDVDEEINRIQIHLDKLEKILTGSGEIGRQIEFLLQELHRETNTLGSKSGNSNISNLVVQMKVQLEKIREQALNIE
jgi:uncharacterized protein (TIGR00255 family)